MLDIVGVVCSIVAVYAALRSVLEKNTLRKLPFINVMNFAVVGILSLTLSHPLTHLVAASYFIGATLEANAIASALSCLIQCNVTSKDTVFERFIMEDES
ncbi:MAG TPA: DUF2109 domain-containing protein [Methanocorpusculum sp.]|nr:DUF2109 domain-containing protein [Methanocorpusculum sp.]HJJ90420.1 DUF2109 domain-containing protein [Methanocorpusculum sp.]HJJ92393.1 DUF2109 domain-containing protein [Methanocorpusculum sp.]